MTKVKALRQFTGKINMFVGEVKEIPDDLANELIAVGYVEIFTEPVVPSGSISITTNGTHDVTEYANANVNVPAPSGSISITANGTYDVTEKASAEVNVPAPALETRKWKSREMGRGSFYVPSCVNGNQFVSVNVDTSSLSDYLYAPIIDGKCEVIIPYMRAGVYLSDGSHGCSLSDSPGEYGYVLTIEEDDAVAYINNGV